MARPTGRKTEEGIVTRIDSAGRVTLPRAMRERMGLAERESVLITGDAEAITIRPYRAKYDLLSTLEALSTQIWAHRDGSTNLTPRTLSRLEGLIEEMKFVIAHGACGED